MSENHSMDVAYIAKLASLELSDRERELFQDQLDRVLAYVNQLNEVELQKLFLNESWSIIIRAA